MSNLELRPMSLGEILDRTFTLYKRNFLLFVTIMLVPYGLIFALQVGSSVLEGTTQRLDPGAAISGAALGTGAVLAILLFFAYFAMIAAAQAATIFAVSDLYLGREPSARKAYARVRGKIGRVVLLLFMVGLAVAGGVLLLIIPGIIAACRTGVAIPAAMLENLKARRAFYRSLELTKGHGMRIFLVFVLVIFLSYAAMLIFQMPFFLAVSSVTRPQRISLTANILNHAGTLLSGVLVGPIGTIAFSLLYYDLRIRKEAFDLEVLMTSLEPCTAAGTPPPA